MISKKTLESSRRVYKKDRKTKRGARKAKNFMAITVAVMLVLVGGYLSYYFTTSEEFSITSYTINGQENSERKIIETYTRQVVNQNIFTAELDKLAKNISSLGWVEEVEIQRVFPDAIEIAITERTPYVYLKQGKKKVLLDKHGFIIVAKKVAGLDLPAIDFSATPIQQDLSFGTQVENGSFQLVINFLSAVEDELYPFGYITRVMEAVDANNYKIVTRYATPGNKKGKNLAILVNREKLKESPNYLGKIFEDFLGKKKTSPSVIDLRFDKQVIMKI